MKNKLRENWMLGFLGFFFLIGIRELMQPDADILDAAWLVWAVWFVYFMPIKKK